MDKPRRTLEIRLGELRPVVDAIELTRALRGKIVGGKKRSARLVRAEGGMSVELLGSSTFVPIAVGTLEEELTVDAHLLAGFLRNSTHAFHPAEIVSFQIGPEHLIATCGTLKVTLMLGARLVPSRRSRDERAVQSSPEFGPMEAESEAPPATATGEFLSRQPVGRQGRQVVETVPHRRNPMKLSCTFGKLRAGFTGLRKSNEG